MTRGIQSVALALLALSVLPEAAFAYVGPGSAISAMGAVLAVLAGLFFAVFGFVWYPVKRLVRSFRGGSSPRATDLGGEGAPPRG